MPSADSPERTNFPLRQRMELAQDLWVRSADDSRPASPAHKRILKERWTAYQAGTIGRVSLAELERRLISRRS